MKTKFYVLQHRETKLLMPLNKVATRASFGDPGVPRLFSTYQAAAQALNCWRQGWWRHHVDSYGESEGPMPSDSKASREVAARRQAIAVDIVPADLILENPAYAPCPTCKQYCHSIGRDELSAALMHFETMFSHRGDGIPTQHVFDEQTRKAAQILIAAARCKQ